MTLQTAQIQTPPGFIDLGRGDPGFDLLPLDLMRRAANEQLGRVDSAILQYGAEQGDGYFRAALAKFLAPRYGFDVDADSLFVTSGISAGLDLLCTLFTKPGDVIFVEEPSYFLALRIFADHGLRVVSIRTDEHGLVVDDLRGALGRDRPKFVYLIPVFQNPGGRTLTPSRREELLKLAHEHDFLVIADEVYQFLNYGAIPPKSFAGFSDSSPVIALNSFSKILAPGLRLGWMHAGAELMKKILAFGQLDSGGGMNPFVSAIVRGAIESGDLDRNIRKLTEIYSRRVQTMEKLLQRHFPQAEFKSPHGGYFFWVRVPGTDAAALRKLAEGKNVGLRQGALFSSRRELNDYMRLSISFYEADDLEEGVKRLRDCL